MDQEPQQVLAEVGRLGGDPRELRVSVGFRASPESFALYAWQTKSVDGADLVDPVIATWGFPEEVRRQDIVGGKPVIRAGPDGIDPDDAIYVYPVGTAAIVIVTPTRSLAEEALANLP